MFDVEKAKRGEATFGEVAGMLGVTVRHLQAWLHGGDVGDDITPKSLVNFMEFANILQNWGRHACN